MLRNIFARQTVLEAVRRPGDGVGLTTSGLTICQIADVVPIHEVVDVLRHGSIEHLLLVHVVFGHEVADVHTWLFLSVYIANNYGVIVRALESLA